MIRQRILEAYAEGSSLSLIAESFKMTKESVKDVLRDYKEESRFKRTFTNEFRTMVAERDINGVARSTIASELQLNINTVKKSCEKFGQALKDKASSEKAFTRINGEFSMDTCPSCGSKHNNKVDDNVTYCMSCSAEHEYYDGYVMKVNFEYIEE